MRRTVRRASYAALRISFHFSSHKRQAWPVPSVRPSVVSSPVLCAALECCPIRRRHCNNYNHYTARTMKSVLYLLAFAALLAGGALSLSVYSDDLPGVAHVTGSSQSYPVRTKREGIAPPPLTIASDRNITARVSCWSLSVILKDNVRIICITVIGSVKWLFHQYLPTIFNFQSDS